MDKIVLVLGEGDGQSSISVAERISRWIKHCKCYREGKEMDKTVLVCQCYREGKEMDKTVLVSQRGGDE